MQHCSTLEEEEFQVGNGYNYTSYKVTVTGAHGENVEGEDS